VIAGHGNHVAVVGLGDEPDGSIPMTGLLTSDGDAWSMPRTTGPWPGGVTSVVVTHDGTTVITNASDGSSRVVDGDMDEIDRKVGEAFVAGDRLYVTSYGFVNGPIFYSVDGGQAWTEDVLPGNEQGNESDNQ
jgi:hypothetical protein